MDRLDRRTQFIQYACAHHSCCFLLFVSGENLNLKAANEAFLNLESVSIKHSKENYDIEESKKRAIQALA
jgi:hypothetical protein